MKYEPPKPPPPHSHTPSIDKLVRLLRKLVRDKFFGEVAISFQNGRPHTVKIHRTLKVDDL